MLGVIFDIKRFAIHDGPGIRTTVFLRGCPLRCAWCHNPESQGRGVARLVGRGGPVAVGRQVAVDEVVATLARDISFYDESGGGVTFSGGEPLAQSRFLVGLLDRCGELEIHRAVDTSGFAPAPTLRRVARRADLFLFDLKLMDAERHARYTGVDNQPILDNLRILCDMDVAIEIRVPVIPGINDGPDDVDALGAFVAGLPRRVPVRLLPYHRAAMDKYPRFGFTPPLPDTPEPTAEQMDRLRARLRALKVEVRR